MSGFYRNPCSVATLASKLVLCLTDSLNWYSGFNSVIICFCFYLSLMVFTEDFNETFNNYIVFHKFHKKSKCFCYHYCFRIYGTGSSLKVKCFLFCPVLEFSMYHWKINHLKKDSSRSYLPLWFIGQVSECNSESLRP